MSRDNVAYEAPTQRDYMKYGGAVVGGGLLAGCTDNDASEVNDPSDGTETPDGTETSDRSKTTGEGSYTVSMQPAGDITFDTIPEGWGTYFPGYAGMGIALVHAQGLTAVGNMGRFYTDHLDEVGVSIDTDEVTQLIGDAGIDKEPYVELGNDVHLTDPEWLTNNDFFGLDDDDIAEISNNVGPFLGNTLFRRTDEWHDYRYYSLYEAFEKIAEVFQERERYEAFAAVHDDVVADIQTRLPSADERPNAFLGFAASDEPEEFSPYRLTDTGTNKRHLRGLGVPDALSGTGVEGLSESNRSKVDYELLLDIDPDVLLLRGHESKSRAAFEDIVVSFMEEHSVASDLTAVESGNVFRGGPIHVGPIHHLFLLERLATTIYPDTFSGELFDRGRVADIVNGDS